MLVAATRDQRFHEVLKNADLHLPDSSGLLWMARLRGQKLPERVPGVDTVQSLCKSLSSDHPIFLLGAAPGIADRAAKELQKHNPQLHIAGAWSGSPKKQEAAAIIDRINTSGAQLLFVAFGAPAQDLWIADHFQGLSTVRVAMGVGGTFDFLAGTIKRAPQWMRALHLEWLWRLILQPKRIGRIFTAVIIFPFLCIREQLLNKY